MAENRGISYINLYGSITNARKRHKQVMKENKEPYVNYTTFKNRLKRGWNLYKAIHTPANAKFRDKDRRRKARFQDIKDKISDFFKSFLGRDGRN
jgi:hypothetical protein